MTSQSNLNQTRDSSAEKKSASHCVAGVYVTYTVIQEFHYITLPNSGGSAELGQVCRLLQARSQRRNLKTPVF